MVEVFPMQVDRVPFKLNPHKSDEANSLPLKLLRLRYQLKEAHILHRVIGAWFRKIAFYLTSRIRGENQ